MLDFAAISCAASLDKPGTPESAAADFLNTSCAKSFCHGRNFVVGRDLRPDSGFATRTLDVPSKREGIPCEDDITTECIPASCPAPGTAKLIDSVDPMSSWLLTPFTLPLSRSFQLHHRNVRGLAPSRRTTSPIFAPRQNLAARA